MAYMDIDKSFAAPLGTREIETASAAAGRFSATEWSVIAVARRDGIGSLNEPGRMSRALGSLFGFGAKSRLADPRLEALRRLAVHTWRRGHGVPQDEIERFVEAGFTVAQAEALVASITGGRVALTQIYSTPRIAA